MAGDDFSLLSPSPDAVLVHERDTSNPLPCPELKPKLLLKAFPNSCTFLLCFSKEDSVSLAE